MNTNILNIYYRKTLDKVDSYEEYLASVNITLDTQLWKKSLLANDKSAYEKYLKFYPKGIYADEAKSKIAKFIEIEEREKEDKLWQKTVKKDTKKAYWNYLELYPNGVYSKSAKLKIDEFIRLEKEKALKRQRLKEIEEAKDKEAWELVCRKNTKEDYENYLKFYPNGIYRKKAQIEINKLIRFEEQRLKEIEEAKERLRLEKIEKAKKLALDKEKEAWELVCRKNTKEDYENYLKFYSNGIYSKSAKSKIDRLIRKQKEAWEKAKKENFSDGYLKYCKNYPNGIYLNEAKKRYEEEKLIEKGLDTFIELLKKQDIEYEPKDIRKLKQIKKLKIYSYSWDKKEIISIPKEIGKLLFLEELIISFYNIEEIPTSIGKLQNLQKLKIDCEAGILLNIPETIGNLNELEELTLKLNKYTKIPLSIQKCLEIKKLDITIKNIYDIHNLTSIEKLGINLFKTKFFHKQNKILNRLFYKELANRIFEKSLKNGDFIENLGLIPNIQELNLNFENLSKIPNWISNYSKLKKLSISSSNNIEELPEWIANYIYLEELSVNTYYSTMYQSEKNQKSKRLTKLPKSICELRNLKKLIVTSGGLSELPEDIGNLGNLEELNIKGHFNSYSFKELPKSIIKLKNLKILNISWKNNLEELPEDIFTLNKLEEFYAVTCNIKEFPKNIINASKLKKIALSGNKISFIPSSIEKLKNLEELYLNGNPLESFPRSVIYLNNLKILVLDKCNLSEIPSLVDNCQKLETLSISHNNLNKLPEKIGKLKNLKQLICGYNSITELPESIYNLENLEYIWIMHNNLSDKCKSKLNKWKLNGNNRDVEY